MIWLLLAMVVVGGAVMVAWGSRKPPVPLPASEPAGFMAAHREAFERVRRPVVTFETSELAEDDLLASKVGGRPYWPEGMPLPEGNRGKALFLLAQVNLGELPSPFPGYPATGMLQFFIADDGNFGIDRDPDQSPERMTAARSYRVVHWPELSAPAKHLPKPRSDKLPIDPGRPRRMHFAAGTETIGPCDHRFRSLLDGDTDRVIADYAEANGLDEDALQDAIWDQDTGPGHKLGGYPSFTQDDPRKDGEFELLFQLDSKDGVMWGDAGVGNFFIRPADLARRDFSRVLYTWDCC